MCIGVLPICMSVFHIHDWCPQRSQESIRSPETGVSGSCEPSCWCWVLDPGLKELQVLLTSEPSLHPFSLLYFFFFSFWNRLSLCKPGWPGSLYVDKASHTLTEISLPLPLASCLYISARIKSMAIMPIPLKIKIRCLGKDEVNQVCCLPLRTWSLFGVHEPQFQE